MGTDDGYRPGRASINIFAGARVCTGIFKAMEYYTYYPSPLGPLLITATKTHLTGIWFDNVKYAPTNIVKVDALPIFDIVFHWLDRYFMGQAPKPEELPLSPAGTAFQKLIWKLLSQIPYGKTTTYGILANQAAEHLGKEKMSAQAVGNAVGRNPISIVIPCHRCLGSGGTLTGYAGGLDRKKYLLKLEHIQYI